jgi:hypothetical protein
LKSLLFFFLNSSSSSSSSMSKLLLCIWNRWSSGSMCANHILPPIECASAPSEVQVTLCRRASPIKDRHQCVQTGGEDGRLHLAAPRLRSPPLLLPGCTTNTTVSWWCICTSFSLSVAGNRRRRRRSCRQLCGLLRTRRSGTRKRPRVH